MGNSTAAVTFIAQVIEGHNIRPPACDPFVLGYESVGEKGIAHHFAGHNLKDARFTLALFGQSIVHVAEGCRLLEQGENHLRYIYNKTGAEVRIFIAHID